MGEKRLYFQLIQIEQFNFVININQDKFDFNSGQLLFPLTVSKLT